MAGYTLYQKRDYNAAILVFDRYIEFNPDSPDRDYAEYMAALCYYEQIVDVGRDQFLTRQAADRFLRLIEVFPNSDYATGLIDFPHVARLTLFYLAQCKSTSNAKTCHCKYV